MQIIQKKITDLAGYSRNARTHDEAQIAQIAASIKEFGFNNPILVDESNTIIAGHGRLAAALRLGLDTVPCIILAHLTDTQRRAYILADNKIALNSGWDMELLSLELGELGELLPLAGFDVDELDEIMAEDDDIQVLDSVGDLSGSNYGDARSTKIPVNILGLGGMVARETMERVKAALLAAGADQGCDNGELLTGIFSLYLERQ